MVRIRQRYAFTSQKEYESQEQRSLSQTVVPYACLTPSYVGHVDLLARVTTTNVTTLLTHCPNAQIITFKV